MTNIEILEQDDAGRIHQTRISNQQIERTAIEPNGENVRLPALEFLGKVFLPTGYPKTVSPDYLRYQILNALQAFCNSLAGLLSSRSVLEGFGVGDASASATNAILVTVLQDFFSRLTTIVGAYYVGSSLSPEAKTYRLLADILNDCAVILDTMSPLFNSPSIKLPGLRIAALCLSGSLRAMCGMVAGGSKSAITLHFASPAGASGDIGDLNAKDASKETVLALCGMLLGGLVVPYLTSPWTTYPFLFLLVGLHVAINYMGVSGLVLRSLNRQRTGLAWSWYRSTDNTKVPSPSDISRTERIFERPGTIRDVHSGRVLGHCSIGSSFSAILSEPIQSTLLPLFQKERYLLWYDPSCLVGAKLVGLPCLHICLKKDYSPVDQLRAWAHAAEVARLADAKEGDVEDLIRLAYSNTEHHFADFIRKMRVAEWNTVDGTLMTSAPRTLLTSIKDNNLDVTEEKKEM
ncbi:vitamin B6 photo-protection and homoeostasis-domain-containing protein [Mycena floridula]|nr:vitamin B6 photo-protection and homoeostasis-domain-containing protein [Mycena floridula]